MKMINKLKYLTLILAVGLSFTACEEDKVEREDSYVPTGDETLAYFPSDESTSFILPLDAESITITIARHDSVDAAEVKLLLGDPYAKFTIPASASFAAGEASTSLDIAFSNLDAFKEYAINVTIDEGATNPYLEDTIGSPQASISILQNDWANYATGQYTSWWNEATYAQDLEYSVFLDRYRFPDVIAEGYALEFTWEGAETVVAVPETAPSGYVHPSYGMVSATTSSSTYDDATKTFIFVREWTVSAGSFGVGEDIFVMD